jgi:hypothetical protein
MYTFILFVILIIINIKIFKEGTYDWA